MHLHMHLCVYAYTLFTCEHVHICIHVYICVCLCVHEDKIKRRLREEGSSFRKDGLGEVIECMWFESRNGERISIWGEKLNQSEQRR